MRKDGTAGACDFCRRMHTSCSGGACCMNCSMRNQVCTYTPRKKPGPKRVGERRETTNEQLRAKQPRQMPPQQTIHITSPSSLPQMQPDQNRQQVSQYLHSTSYNRPSSYGPQLLWESPEFLSVPTGLPGVPLFHVEESTHPPATLLDSTSGALNSYNALCTAITPPSFMSNCQPYRAYFDSLVPFVRGDPLSVMEWVEIPPLDYLLPLAALSKEGRLRQAVLFAVLGVGAMAHRHTAESHMLIDNARKLVDEWVDYDWERSGDNALMTLAGRAFVATAASLHTLGHHDTAEKYEDALHKVYTTLFCRYPTANPSLEEQWMASHVIINTKGKGLPEDRMKRITRAISAAVQPNLKLWLLFGGIWDFLLEAGVRPAKHRKSLPYSYAWDLINQAFDVLTYVSTHPELRQSQMRKHYQGVFLGAKAVLARLTGYHHSAEMQAAAAAQQLIQSVTVVNNQVPFFGAAIILSFVAKVLKLSNNMAMAKASDEALMEVGKVVPGISFFHHLLVRIEVDEEDAWLAAGLNSRTRSCEFVKPQADCSGTGGCTRHYPVYEDATNNESQPTMTFDATKTVVEFASSFVFTPNSPSTSPGSSLNSPSPSPNLAQFFAYSPSSFLESYELPTV